MRHKPYVNRFSSRSKQSGVVLLTLILLVLTAASFVLLKGLNENARNTTGFDQVSTRSVLKEAKSALIGYAVAYPDNHSGAKGPGRLPCPDYQYTPGGSDPLGSSDSCSLAAGTETGLFPFYTVETNDMFDASGARLWYAVSNNHRANTGNTVNSDTVGTITVDTTNDVVAVIIAPGPALGSQNRNTANVANLYDASEYLEGENASSGDNLFTAISLASQNDQVITITRRELMQATEARVISTVAKALNHYFKDPDGDDVGNVDPDCSPAPDHCDDGFPWLSPLTDPSLSDYVANVGTRDGHVALVANGRAYATLLNYDWSIPTDGTYTSSGSTPPSEACVRTALCTVSGVSTSLPIGDLGATCTWNGREAIQCSTVETIDLGGGDKIEREYIFSFSGLPMTIAAPTASSNRSLNYSLSFARLPPGASGSITLTDNFIPSGGSPVYIGTATLSLNPADAVTSLAMLGMAFFQEVDNDGVIYPAVPGTGEQTSPGELPEWFLEDNWHQLLIVSYATAESPGNLISNCVVDSSCLSIQWTRQGSLPATNLNNLRGVVLSAGADLGAGRPSANLSDYFEGENTTVTDRIFAKSSGATNFNDQIKVLDPDG